MSKTVSVIIPTYGGNASLKRAVDSVLQQDYTDFEVIVVDDNNPETASRTITEEIMNTYSKDKRVVYIKHEKNKNGAAARNTAAKNATGEYFAFLDDDDIFLQGKLKKQVAFLRQHSNYDAVYCWRVHEGKVIGSSLAGDLSAALMDLSFTPCTPSVLIRREAYFDINGFDESYIRHQDFEFLLRFFEKHKMGVLPEPLIEILGNGVDNQPKGKKAVEIKKKFLSTFEKNINTINKIDKGYKKRVYAKHYANLLLKLLRYGHIRLAADTYFREAYKGGIQFWKEFFLEAGRIFLKRIVSRCSRG